MISPVQRITTLLDATLNRGLQNIYKTMDEITDQANAYMPPPGTYCMGAVNQSNLAAGLWTPFVASGQTAIYADSVDTSIVEVQLIYSSGTTDFNIRLREAAASDFNTIYSSTTVGAAPAPNTARMFSFGKLSVGQIVATANTPYVLEVTPTTTASVVYAANLKVVRGTKP